MTRIIKKSVVMELKGEFYKEYKEKEITVQQETHILVY